MMDIEKALVISGLQDRLLESLGLSFLSDNEVDFIETLISKHYGDMTHTDDAIRLIDDIKNLGLRLLYEIKEAETDG